MRKVEPDKVQEIKSRILTELEEIITYGREDEEAGVILEFEFKRRKTILKSSWMTLIWPGGGMTCTRNEQRPWRAGSGPTTKLSSTKTSSPVTT